MVFVNKINNAMKITAYLYLLLLLKEWKQENFLIRTFYPNFEASTYLNLWKILKIEKLESWFVLI